MSLRLGLLLPKHKKEKIQLPEKIEKLCKEHNIEVTDINCDNLLENGPFDVVLHKVTDYYTECSTDETEKKIEKFREYVNRFPGMVVIDHIDGCIKMTDRKYQTKILKACQMTLSNITVFVPKIFEIPINANIEDVHAIIDREQVKFPILAKPLTASLAAGSHMMTLIFSKNNLTDLPIPCLMQEFCNHSGVVYKVFAVGERYNMCERPSIKDIDCSSNKTLIFDTRNVSKTGKAYIPDLHVSDPNLRTWLSCDDQPDMLNHEVVRKICCIIKRETNLKLFGFDILIEKATGNYALIDVNHFPGYTGINEKYFPEHLVELILHEGRKK